MYFITGECTGDKMVKVCQENGWGRMFIEKTPRPYPGEMWGFDNGVFRDYTAGHDFNQERYLKRLKKAHDIGIPYLAVLPDIIAGGKDSLEFSLKWLDKLPRDWPWYLALQDGMTLEEVETHIHRFSGLFLGGTNTFKGTAWYWKELAHKHNKLFHYGRAGTAKKIIHAQLVKADSADSAFPLWTVERLRRTVIMLQTEQQSLFEPQEIAIKP